MKYEQIEIVDKVWGKEIVIVNNGLFCGKFLCYDEDAESSLHFHSKKTETFYGINGSVDLEIEGKIYSLNQFARPKTILPGEKHRIMAITEATILEVSTVHSDDDVTRLTESKSGVV